MTFEHILENPALYIGSMVMQIAVGHFAASGLYWLRFRKNPLVLYKEQAKTKHLTHTRWIAFFAVAWSAQFIAFLYFIPFREFSLAQPLFKISPAIGWFFVVVGILGMAICQCLMGSAFRIGQDESPQSDQTRLRENGIYSISRNPIYLFSCIYTVGATLWVPSLLMISTCMGLIFHIHGLVLSEETFLKARFGNKYEDYLHRVPRYI